MADDALTVLEHCRVSPPPATIGEKSLQLTFFDLIWLQFFPLNRLFFFEFPCSRTHFVETIVPNLKHSLSITLEHFFPFAGKLIIFSKPRKPKIQYVEGDSVAVTFAESSGLNYHDLAGNHPRPCNKFYELVPRLGRATKVSDYVTIPLFSVQVTLFPNRGVSIGLTNHHTLCDASTICDFLKAWSSIAKHGKNDEFLASESLRPLYDRAIKYPDSLDEIYMNQPGIERLNNSEYQPAHPSGNTDKVRATVVLKKTDINQLKTWVSTQRPTLEYVSSFSVACAYIWSCVAKSAVEIGEKKGEDELERFICAVDWRTRLSPPVPQTYFGNCVGLCDTDKIESRMISGNNGFLTAVELIGKAINRALKNKDGMLKDAEMWLVRGFEPVPAIGVAGTPKVKIYDTDFGWGKPSKYETISIDYNGSISVNACKESPEDIEIGLSLDAKQMAAFLIIFKRELQNKIIL